MGFAYNSPKVRGSRTYSTIIANAALINAMDKLISGVKPAKVAMTPPISGLMVATDVSAVVESANRIGTSFLLPNSRIIVCELIMYPHIAAPIVAKAMRNPS